MYECMCVSIVSRTVGVKAELTFVRLAAEVKREAKAQKALLKLFLFIKITS